MIKIENVVTPSPEQWKALILGARNAMNSWEKSDSGDGCVNGICGKCGFNINWCGCTPRLIIGKNDYSLMMKLRNTGTDHRKFMRMIAVYVDILAPLYWWKEFDTYKVGTVANSCSTMHKIAAKEFTLEDFSTEHLTSNMKTLLKRTIDTLNDCREWYLKYDSMRDEDKNYFEEGITCKKDIWWQMIQLLPSSYNQKRTVMLNYEVLANMYKSRKDHKLDEWREFCKWVKTLPYSELITGEKR